MSVVLLAATWVVVVGGIMCVVGRDARTVVAGLFLTLAAAPLLADPLRLGRLWIVQSSGTQQSAGAFTVLHQARGEGPGRELGRSGGSRLLGRRPGGVD